MGRVGPHPRHPRRAPIGESRGTLPAAPAGPRKPAGARAGADARWLLDGKVALVTGASAGLGARFGRVLHAAGAHIIMTGRRADRLTELAHECQTRMGILVGDIADPAHRQHPADVARRHGPLDVLVNNAGASVINVSSMYGIVASLVRPPPSVAQPPLGYSA